MMGSKSDQFINDLVQFYRNKGHNNPQLSPQNFITRINGKIVDLNELYTYVIESGGSFKVTQLNLWDDIYCKLFRTCVVGANISVALRQIYARFLLPYEKVFSTNFGNDLLDDDEDESSSHSHNHNHSFNSLNQNTSSSVPLLSYQYPQNVTINTTNTSESRNPLNKLFCSLLSGLPNELDFALKVSTILTNSNRFDWNSDYKFVDLLLECSKKYCCICDQQIIDFSHDLNVDNSDIFGDDEQNVCNCYQRFWYQCCPDEQVMELAFNCYEPNFEQLSDQDFRKIEERIRLIADIIRNVSFTYDSDSDENLCSGFVVSPLLMKFLLLLSNSSLQQFNYIAFDIISNIAPTTAFITDETEFKVIQQSLHRRCVEIAMTSNDIHWTSRSLEIVARLFSTNCEEICSFLESQLREYEVFVRITHLMTCQYDIPLLLAILEFCLSLSQQRPHLLVKEDNKQLIKLLLTLLNCEASQHFSTSALKKMRVIDDRPRNQSQSSETSGQTVSVVTSGQNNSSQSNSIDNETFAMNWLRTTYEPNTNLNDNHSLKASDVYADYVKQCCRSSRRNVMAAQPFSQLIKRCFPSSSLTNNQTTIEGIVAKTVQNIQNKSNGLPAPQLMSPILKAHLSAPPKSNGSTTVTTNSNNSNTSNQTTNTTANTTSSVKSNTSTGSNTTLSTNSLSIPTTNTSTLIKSLLANKLRSNATTTTSTTTSNSVPTVSTTVISPSVSPTKSIPITSAKVTTINTKPVPTPNTTSINTNNSTISDINGETIGNNSGQQSLPSAITLTPSVTTYSLTTNNTIIPSNATLSGHTVQPQQQFLLVRTIITSPGQQQSGSSLTASGTPVRLILPASMLTQQRLNTPAVNGITTTSSPLTNVTLTTVSANSLSPNNNTSTVVSSNTSDIFLKTVLSNSNGSGNSVPPLRSNVKSSPLLNVLLDKGKLPEFSTTTVLNNQVTGMPSSATTLMTPQTPKMYILTTKSPLAIKSLPALQTQQLNQSQCVTQLSPVSNQNQSQNNTSLKACLQNFTSSSIVANTTVTTTTSNHSVVNKPSIPKISVTPIMNGDIGTPVHSPNSVVNSVNSINNITNNVNAVNNSPPINAGPPPATNSVNAINSIPSSDLSSFKDIKKAVDDATRLLAKRPNESSDGIGTNKKLKINSVVNSICPSNHNSISNHDSESNSISINNLTNNSQQVLNKASNLPTVSTTTLSVASTITTITSNNKTICNTTNNNINNKENDSSVNSDVLCFECQWNDCKKTFSRASEVFLHVHNHHIMPSTFPNIMTCLWGGPEGTGPGCLSKRPKLSLLTHLLDFHCNPNVLQQENVRKKQLSSGGSTAITLPQPPAHPGYAHNAALLAIKRHATNYVEAPTLPPVTELTPLTVSIRLTCALILRNLTIHSNFVKRTLECFEQYLCELCMSDGRDESRTIAQCLALINDQT